MGGLGGRGGGKPQSSNEERAGEGRKTKEGKDTNHALLLCEQWEEPAPGCPNRR